MAIDVILGLQWGDEGKGKIVDALADQYDVIARFQGGPNAGHTLHFDGNKFVLHTIPSGIFRPDQLNLIGNGVVIDPITLRKELNMLDKENIDYKDRLLVARKAHLILPTHRYIDAASEAAKGKEKIGSTLKGIGPTYMDKTGRNGIRVGDIDRPDFDQQYQALKKKHLGLLQIYPDFEFDLASEEEQFFDSLERLRQLKKVNGEYFINEAIEKKHRILAEGAQGSMLDIDFGTYPFVTSSNTITAGVCTGLGVAPNKIDRVIGITKAYCTRVGGGPFPTELHGETGALLQKEGNEFGATTGRPRRCGWIDIPQLQYTCMINGVSDLVITKIDVLNNFNEIKAGVNYSYDSYQGNELPYDVNSVDIDIQYQAFEGWNTSLADIKTFEKLPEKLKTFIQSLEDYLKLPVSMISTGPDREELIEKQWHAEPTSV